MNRRHTLLATLATLVIAACGDATPAPDGSPEAVLLEFTFDAGSVKWDPGAVEALADAAREGTPIRVLVKDGKDNVLSDVFAENVEEATAILRAQAAPAAERMAAERNAEFEALSPDLQEEYLQEKYEQAKAAIERYQAAKKERNR